MRVTALRGIVFDLDGTLFDHDASTRAALAEWLPRLGAVAGERLTRAWFAAEDEHFESWRSGLITFDEQRRRRLRDLLPLLGRPVGSDADLDVIFSGFLDAYERAWRGYVDVRPALDRLVGRGLVLGVLTNGTVTQQQAKVVAIGVSELVTAVVTAEELGHAKPDARTYAEACRRIGLAPAEVLHVGDRHDLDVIAARAAGLSAWHLDRDDLRLEPAAARVADLTELADRLAAED